ncbi:heme exporter protein CcmD [Rhizobium sp.]
MVMSHAFYVYSAWGIGAATLIAVTAYTWMESVRLKRELARLEAQGIRRRSAASGGERA